MTSQIPIILFAYARPQHLKRVLKCLRENEVPLIHAFCDGPKTSADYKRLMQVRKMLHEVDWCEIRITERIENMGLGKSILAGCTESFVLYDKIIVFEDDIICIPGTYQYLCAALLHYEKDLRVMSVTGWTHPLVTPGDCVEQPYFDGRAECWCWGAWARSWQGIEQDAFTLMQACKDRGIDIYRYGADLPDMAKYEKGKNIWAVRFLYLHILNRALCLRPPRSMVEHIGYDNLGTNAKEANNWMTQSLKNFPFFPEKWTEPVEHPDCTRLWISVTGKLPTLYERVCRFGYRIADKSFRLVSVVWKKK